MHLPFSFAMFDAPAVIGTMIPIVIFMIPIVAILANHQQKMARIIHGHSEFNEINDLRREIADLRNLVQRQSYAIEQMNSRDAIPNATAVDLPLRLGSEQ